MDSVPRDVTLPSLDNLCPHIAMGGQTPGVALVGGRVTPRRTCWKISGDPGARGRPTSGRPALLPGHLAQPGAKHSGPRPPVSSGSGTRGPTGGHGPTPSLAGHLATQEGAKRGGAGVAGTPSFHGADHFSELIRSTFLEEVPMGMVDGPLTKVEAAARCGCNMEDRRRGF